MTLSKLLYTFVLTVGKGLKRTLEIDECLEVRFPDTFSLLYLLLFIMYFHLILFDWIVYLPLFSMYHIVLSPLLFHSLTNIHIFLYFSHQHPCLSLFLSLAVRPCIIKQIMSIIGPLTLGQSRECE